MTPRTPDDGLVVVADDTTGSSDEDLAALDAVLGLLDTALDRVRALDDASPAPVAGSSGEAGENRSIRHTRARLVQEDTRRITAHLTDTRDRVNGVVEQARLSTAASRDRRAAHRRPAAGESHHLVDVLDRAARRLLDRGEESVEHTLALIVGGAIAAVPGASRAGITLLERGGAIRSYAPSDTVVSELDALQDRLGEGPCRDATQGATAVLTHDLERDEARWPRFAPAARRHGIGAVLSMQLFGRDTGTVGALNLYADHPRVFDEAAVEVGSLFASHAALALYGARRTAQLNEALRSRDVIGQAKGILMQRFGVDEDRAFAMLVSSSQDTNMKLRAVADWVVAETAKGHDTTG